MTNKSEIIEFLNSHPNMQLATVDQQGLPRTRGMFMYAADAEGIVFHTGTFKALNAQLKGNPHVEASFFDAKSMIQVRVQGTVQEIDDQAFKEKIVATPGREFLKPLVAAKGYGAFTVYRITACRATVWTMQTNTQYPKPEVIF